MTEKLTAKQEGFCLSVAEGKSLSQAYRDNYNAENMSNECLWVKACELGANGKVGVRMAELQEAAKERTLVTIETITKEYEENRAAAKGLDQPAAMNTATTGKAKLHGLMVEKAEVAIRVEKIEVEFVNDNSQDKDT